MFLYLSLIETEEDKIKFEAIFNNYKKLCIILQIAY